jgi:hypothetical protein
MADALDGVAGEFGAAGGVVEQGEGLAGEVGDEGRFGWRGMLAGSRAAQTCRRPFQDRGDPAGRLAFA